MKITFLNTVCLVVFVTSLSACGSNIIHDKKIDYKKTSTDTPSLEIPPELVLEHDETLRIPDAQSVTYSEYDDPATHSTIAPSAKPILPTNSANIHLYRDGDTHWLMVASEPAILWPKIQQFWREIGFELSRADAAVGILETNWAENRANIPDDLIRRTIGRVLDFAYDSSTRDMYRTRIERGHEPGTTEIYISHKGMQQVVQNDTLSWVARPSDPNLEAEMLKRLMIFLGADKQSPDAIQATQPVKLEKTIQPRLVQGNDGQPRIELGGDFPDVWRRTGLALDHGGFTVEDQDRSKGDYYVRYIGKNQDEKSFLSKLTFWRSDEAQKIVYTVHVSRGESKSLISLFRRDGQRVEAERIQQILEVLATHFR